MEKLFFLGCIVAVGYWFMTAEQREKDKAIEHQLKFMRDNYKKVIKGPLIRDVKYSRDGDKDGIVIKIMCHKTNKEIKKLIKVFIAGQKKAILKYLKKFDEKEYDKFKAFIEKGLYVKYEYYNTKDKKFADFSYSIRDINEIEKEI